MRIADIDESFRNIFPDMHVDTIFVNEFGMYDLILKSRTEKAEKFRILLTTKILPSIKQFGFYSIGDKNKQKLTTQNKEMINKIKILKNEVKILKK